MIFFRAHTVEIKYQRGEESFLLFGRLKAEFSAPVDDLSGMTVNLKDVDQWMREAQSKALSFRHREEVLRYYFNALKKSSAALKRVELKLGSGSVSYDGKKNVHTCHSKTWFKTDRTWVQRKVKLHSERAISKNFCSQLRQKKWSSPAALMEILKNHLPGLQILEIQFPEKQFSQKFYLS